MIAFFRRLSLPLPWRVVRKRLEAQRQYHHDLCGTIEAFEDPEFLAFHRGRSYTYGRLISEGDEARRRGHRVGLYVPRSR